MEWQALPPHLQGYKQASHGLKDSQEHEYEDRKQMRLQDSRHYASQSFIAGTVIKKLKNAKGRTNLFGNTYLATRSIPASHALNQSSTQYQSAKRLGGTSGTSRREDTASGRNGDEQDEKTQTRNACQTSKTASRKDIEIPQLPLGELFNQQHDGAARQPNLNIET